MFNDGLATVSVTLVDPERAELKVTDNSTGTLGASSPIAVGEPATTTTSTVVSGTSGPVTPTSLASTTTMASTPSAATTTANATAATTIATATTTTATTVPTMASTPGFFSVAPAIWAPGVGSQFEVTLTALNGADSVDVGYTGPRCVTFTGPDNAPDGRAPGYPAAGDCAGGSSVVFNDGLASVSVTLVDPERAELKVTDNSVGMFGTCTVLVLREPARP